MAFCHANEGVEFVTEAPGIELQNGIAIFTARSGGKVLKYRAMEICTFVRFVERAQRALRRHAAGDEAIIVED